MKKAVALISIIVLVLSFMLTACAPAKLADSFKEEEVIAHVKDIVSTVNAKDYASVSAQVREDLQSKLSADVLKSALDKRLSDAGSFKEFKTVATYGQKSDGEDFAVTVAVCSYQNSTLTYTISLDKSLKIVGFYVK